MKNLMKLSTAVTIALIIAGIATFPVLAIAGILAWVYIDQEYDDKSINGFNFDEKEE